MFLDLLIRSTNVSIGIYVLERFNDLRATEIEIYEHYKNWLLNNNF